MLHIVYLAFEVFTCALRHAILDTEVVPIALALYPRKATHVANGHDFIALLQIAPKLALMSSCWLSSSQPRCW